MLTVRMYSELNIRHKELVAPHCALGVPRVPVHFAACACRQEGQKAGLNVQKGSKITTHMKVLSKVAAGGEQGCPVCACNGERFRHHSHATRSNGARLRVAGVLSCGKRVHLLHDLRHVSAECSKDQRELPSLHPDARTPLDIKMVLKRPSHSSGPPSVDAHYQCHQLAAGWGSEDVFGEASRFHEQVALGYGIEGKGQEVGPGPVHACGAAGGRRMAAGGIGLRG